MDLKDNIDTLGHILLLPWILNPKFSKFQAAFDELLRGLQKYLDLLKSALQRTNKNHDKPTPGKNLNENWVLRVCETTQQEVDRSYKPLIERLNVVDMYETIDLCDLEPENKETRRKWLSHMTLPFPVSVFTYRYGNYLGNLNMVWKIPFDI